MTGFVKRGSIHTSDLATFKRHSVSEQTVELHDFLLYKCNDVKVLLPNVKAVGQPQTKLAMY